MHGHASQWLMLKGHLQYSSASCCMVTAWFAGDFSCTSYLKFSLHTIFRFTWMGKVKGNGVCSKRLGSWFTLCWPDTYRCFLNRIAAYLQHASHSMLFKLLDYKRVIWFLPGVAGDQTISQTWYFSRKLHHLILVFDFMHKKGINFGIAWANHQSSDYVISSHYILFVNPIISYS